MFCSPVLASKGTAFPVVEEDSWQQSHREVAPTPLSLDEAAKPSDSRRVHKDELRIVQAEAVQWLIDNTR